MLLATLTANLQASYAAIQSQVESLQEQQRLIQAQLQRVGSVESKMESAAALVAEAIAEIREVCPDELNSYQQTIASLFDDAPIAQLTPAADETTSTDELNPAPVEPEPSIEVQAEVIEVEADVTVEQLMQQADAISSNPIYNEGVADESPTKLGANDIVAPQVLHRQKTKSLQWLATQKGIEYANMKRHELAKLLTGQVTQVELERAIHQAV